MSEQPEMTIDERLRFLLASTESLHSNLQEISAQQAQQIEESKRQSEELLRQAGKLGQQAVEQTKHQRAIITAMTAYLKFMSGEPNEEQP